MPPSSANTLLDYLSTSPLLSPAQLAELKQLRQHLPQPKALAQELVRRRWLTPFQATMILQGRGQELILGPYLLLEKLGQGGYGQVFKARHRKLNRLVALKALRPELLKDQETVQRFFREIEVASQLSHPHIVHAYEAGPIGDLLVLVMEHVEGKDLEELVRQFGPLQLAQACDFIRQAAVGLQYAHEKGLVHRDIKPSNLLVGAPGRAGDSSASGLSWGKVKILDLGLARLQQPVRGSTTSHLTVMGSQTVMQGSPDYMSPEQAIDFHSADIRSDIYSLGCTFHYLLTGQPPFAGGSLAEKLMKHQQAQPALDELAELPAPVRTLLGKMLAKQPADRQQTPAEVEQALLPYCGIGPAASPETDSAPTDPALLQPTLPELPPPPSFVWHLLRKRVWLPVFGCLGLGAVVCLGMPGLFSAKPTPTGIAVETAKSVPAPIVERAFLEKDGQVVMESENFTGTAPGKGAALKHAWAETTKLRGYSGKAALIALPNTGSAATPPDSPRCDYRIRFTKAGTYHVWARILGANGTDDSIHVGLDDKPVVLPGFGLGAGGNAWVWVDRIGSRRVSIQVAEPGLHTFQMWMREDGTAVDKFVLTLDAAFKPTALGPDESFCEPGP
jgi:serine/threonine protein kinase